MNFHYNTLRIDSKTTFATSSNKVIGGSESSPCLSAQGL